MLRVSGRVQGDELDVTAIRDGAEAAEHSGIPHAELLVRFADALVAHDEAGMAALRGPIESALGGDGLVEAAAVAANFQRMVRIADGTGIPTDSSLQLISGDVVEELQLRDLNSSKNSPETSAFKQLAGRVFRPIAPKLMGLAGKLRASS